mmetsp:Transcript_26915/g.104451  ORF Transcript_26915/g.104451 Transcript_26915/m.104451 type:complete len:376 (+) Transcript_26915:627-1754(+)
MDTMSLNSKGQRALFGTRTKRMKDFTAKFDDLALNVDMGDDRLEGLMFVASASGDFNGVYVSPHPFVSATLAAPPFSCPICSNPKEAHPTARDCICDDCAKIILTPLRSPDEDIGSSRRASKATKDQQAGSKDSTGTPLRVELEDRRKSKAMEAATERPRSEGTSGEPSGGPATPSKAREENPKRPRRESSAAKSPSYGRTRDTRASLEAKLAVEIETNMPLSKKVGRSTNNVSRDRCAEQATSQDKPQIKGAGREKRVLERHPAPTTQAHGKSLETRNMEESPGHCESRVTTRNQVSWQANRIPKLQIAMVDHWKRMFVLAPNALSLSRLECGSRNRNSRRRYQNPPIHLACLSAKSFQPSPGLPFHRSIRNLH